MGYKATPITYKACKSPLKADAALIAGAADVGASKQRGDYGAIVTAAMESGKGRTNYTSFDKPGKGEDGGKEEEEKTENKGQSDEAVEPGK